MRYPILMLALIASAARGAARALRFDLHGSFCGGFGVQACVKERAITATPFVFREP